MRRVGRRLRHGGYAWHFWGQYWVWEPQVSVFAVFMLGELVLMEPRTPAGFLVELAGATAIAWIWGWRGFSDEDE